MGNLLTISAALATGLCTFFLTRALLSYMAMLGNERVISHEVYQILPLTLRLGRPLIRFFRPIARKEFMQKNVEIADKKLWMAGYGETISALDYTALKLVYAFFGLVVFLLCARIGHTIIGAIFGIIFALYPTLWINASIKSRHLAILKALPNVLDLLTLSVEAGKDFITSLRDILARRTRDPLGDELTRAFQEIQLGRKRADALRDLGKRVGQTDLIAVLNAIIQAEELGVSIGQLLRIQGDMLRNKRFTLAEKLANEAPVKIIIPVVAFIFPAVMLILFGPILMQAFKTFGW